MQAISEAMQAALAQPVRAPLHLRVACDVVDTTAAPDATQENTAAVPYTNATACLTRRTQPQKTVATWEKGRLRLDGSQTCAPAAGLAATNEGFISAALCAADGTFAAPPCLTFTFAKAHTIPALTLDFGAVYECVPQSITLCFYAGETLLEARTLTPENTVYVAEDIPAGFTRLVLQFNAMQGGLCRARLSRICFGYSARFTEDTLGGVKAKWVRDPIARSLPTETLQCSVVAHDALRGIGGEYDPDDPQGVWRWLEQPCPITAWCGTGEEDEILLGQFYLAGTPKTDDVFLHLTANSVLATLTDTCTCGAYTGTPRTLLALALAVLGQANLPLRDDGTPPYSLWPGLADITTTAPLPQKPLRECLQLIAHAACCTLYTRRDGVVCIAPLSEEVGGQTLDFNEMTEKPAVAKIAALSAVQCKVYTYTQNEDGTVQHTTALYTDAVADALPAATAETVDNPLVTSTAHAAALAAHIKAYLLLRNTYTVQTRGEPALDALDMLALQTPFAASVPACVLSQQLDFSNGLKGSIKAKRMEAV